MKKYNCLLALLVSVFLLLCACAQQQSSPASSDPDTLSSTPSSSVPASSVPATSVPATSVPATSTPATSAPATEPAPPIQISTDWVVENREIIPFEERFEEDVYFGTTTTRWFVQEEGSTFIRYALSTRKGTYPLAVWNYDSIIYEISCDRTLTNYDLLIGDGLWAYLASEEDLIRVDLRTGASTTLLTRGSNIIFWRVYPCGKDTICIFEIDAEKNFRIFYRDLHSDAEKMLYEGILPESSPHDYASNGKYAAPGNRGISFTPPISTQGTFSWRMMNPAFYVVVQKELANPDSQFKQMHQQDYSKCWEDLKKYPIHLSSCPALCDAIENAYDIPYRIEYTYNPITGTLTEDYGIIDGCFYGSGYSHDHYDYENTREEPVTVLNSDPVDIPTITKLTAEQAEEALADEPDYYYKNTVLYSEYGHGHPYWLQDGKFIKLADIECTGFISTQYYVYCFTTENTIVQISPDGNICNTIYTANAEMDDWFYDLGSIYVQDGNQVIRINIVNGTRQVLLESNGNIYIRAGGDDFGEISVDITQGLYYQQHFFNPDTGELEETDYL